MRKKISILDFNQGLQKLKEEYMIFAPVKKPFKGLFSDTAVIRYEEVKKLEDIELNEKSNFSPKEVLSPITEILFYFTEEEYKVPAVKDKKILLFLRACDVNALKRFDEIYLNNGIEEDFYYKRLREKLKIVLIGCKESFRNCFCVSMESNRTDNYDMAINMREDNVYLHLKDQELEDYFNGGVEEDFEVDYVRENLIKVETPDIDKLDLKKVVEDKSWEEYNSRCISCGRCTVVCPTCTCFSMQDVYYNENENVGERRRVWASCQVDGYSDMAGGHSFRKTKGDRLRFKALHKVYDFKKRFGYNMCVGCGRCDDVCTEYISFSKQIEKITNLVNGKGM